MVSVTGIPYDTLRGVLGITGDGNGSLKEFGIQYEQIDLKDDGTPDYEAMERELKPGIKMVYIQRSCGYSLRPSLFVEDIQRIAEIAKRKAPGCIVMVDNCYVEFLRENRANLPRRRFNGWFSDQKSGWWDCAHRWIHCRKKGFGGELFLSPDYAGHWKGNWRYLGE